MEHAGLDPLQRERLRHYARLVRRWSGRVNLVSKADLDRFEDRHVADCLRALPLLDGLPPGGAIDLGSGAGLPGVPLAIAEPERPWRLVEPKAKRAAFLEEVVRELDLTCEVIVATAQEAVRLAGFRSGHVVATARALAQPEGAFRALAPFVAPGGVSVVFVGRGAPIPREAVEWADGIAIIRREAPSGERR